MATPIIHASTALSSYSIL